MRLAFMGTPDFAVAVLDALAARHDIVFVYTQPPRPTGRGHRTQASPVALRAEALGIPVRHPASLRGPEEQAAFHALDLDAAVVAAYGLILPRAILAAPRLGCINVHASLLPRWRGAAPIQRAILAGDAETGVTIMQMAAGLDTGPMLMREAVPIGPWTTATGLHDVLSALGARLVGDTLAGLEAGRVVAEPQPETGVTYAAKLERDEARIDWREPAHLIERKVRALNPAPGVWFTLDGERIKLLAAELAPGSGPAGQVLDGDLLIACGAGALRPTLLQRAGKAPVDRRAFLNGRPVAAGIVLACPASS